MERISSWIDSSSDAKSKIRILVNFNTMLWENQIKAKCIPLVLIQICWILRSCFRQKTSRDTSQGLSNLHKRTSYSVRAFQDTRHNDLKISRNDSNAKLHFQMTLSLLSTSSLLKLTIASRHISFHLSSFQTTVETPKAIASPDDWLRNLAPVFQPMRSKRENHPLRAIIPAL